MDVVERLSPEEAGEATLIAITHRHRYELAAELCAGLRVLDLCCGTGYGTEILARSAASVDGVDVDAGSIESARRHYGSVENASFESVDALEVLECGLETSYDAIVVFEGLEHLAELDRATTLLGRHAAAGLMLIASLPNSIPFGERNEHHVTEFDEEGALAVFESIGAAVVLRQFHAEGSLIRAAADGPLDGSSALAERAEPEHCNHLLAIFNPAEARLDETVSARMQLVVAPASSTYMLALERANKRLWRTNQQLARERIGMADSAAAALLAKVPPDPERQPASRSEPLYRLGRRLRTVIGLIVPHGFMVLLAKLRDANRPPAE